MTTLYILTISLFLLVSLILCGVILMQESKSGGLGTMLGGDPTSSVFGTSTADVLKKITGWLSFAFLSLCVLLSIWTASMGRPQAEMPLYETEQVD